MTDVFISWPDHTFEQFLRLSTANKGISIFRTFEGQSVDLGGLSKHDKINMVSQQESMFLETA